MVLSIFTLHSSPMEQAPSFVNQEFYHLLSPEVQRSLGNVLLFEHKNDEQWYYQTNTGEGCTRVFAVRKGAETNVNLFPL